MTHVCAANVCAFVHLSIAILYKNATLQIRQKKTVCCQLFIPVLLVCLVGVIQVEINGAIENEVRPGGQNKTFNASRIDFEGDRYFDYLWDYIAYSKEEAGLDESVGYLNGDGNGTGLLGNIDQYRTTYGDFFPDCMGFGNKTANATCYIVPQFVPFDSPDDMYSNLTKTKKIDIGTARANGQSASCEDCPPVSVVFRNLEEVTEQVSLSYKIMTDMQLDQGPGKTEAFASAKWNQIRMANMLNVAFLRDLYTHLFLPFQAMSNSISTFKSETRAAMSAAVRVGADDDSDGLLLPFIEIYTRPLPTRTQSLMIDVASAFATFMLPLGLFFLFPVFVYGIVNEKQEKLRGMMLMMGLQMRWYWLVTCLFNFLMYIVVVFLVVIIALAFNLRVFTQTSPLILFFSFLFWGFAIVTMSILFSSFFSSSRTATIVSYLIVIASVICSNVLSSTTNFNALPNPVFLFYAPFAFFRIIFIIGTRCSVGTCPQWDDRDEQFAALWFFLILDTFLYLVIGLYLDAIIPSQWGVRRHPLFPLHALQSLCGGEKQSTTQGGFRAAREESRPLLEDSDSANDDDDDADGAGVAVHMGSGKLSAPPVLMLKEDPHVIQEKQLIKDVMNNRVAVRGKKASDAEAEYIEQSSERVESAFRGGMVAANLRKVYDGGKVAVKGTYLAVPEGECFGLLGPNGAGKTTTISMLTGLFSPSKGGAKVGGFDLESELYKVHRIMGVCPQFDCLWDSLTCRETLLFYSRLKGVPSDEEKEHVDKSLLSVGLQEFADRKVKELSGGMKRRVSLAVSLCGKARVIFLDEPTTGLDPVTRRALWDTLLDIKRDKRCIILTTHSMEEADVLCDRIGIMSMGELKCLGTALYLKNKYGTGYAFTVQFAHRHKDRMMQYVSKILPQATVRDDFPGHVVYNLNREDFRISELFREVGDNGKENGIVDWGLTQTSMEDVFLNVAENDASFMKED